MGYSEQSSMHKPTHTHSSFGDGSCAILRQSTTFGMQAWIFATSASAPDNPSHLALFHIS